MNIKVLLIEDDLNVVQSLQLLFSSEGITCDVASKGEEGLEMARLYSTNYDLVILDLMLDDLSGFEILLKLRSAKIKIPVLILSGLSSVEDKIKGLGLGADDYLAKPFNRGELIARMHAIVRRSKGHAESVLKFDKISINLDSRTVEVDGKMVHLTSKEYSILELLAMRRGNVLNKEIFLNHLYGGVDEPELKIIDVFVCKLRRKLYEASGGKNYIDTVWGRGYMLKESENSTAVGKTSAQSDSNTVCESQG